MEELFVFLHFSIALETFTSAQAQIHNNHYHIQGIHSNDCVFCKIPEADTLLL